jgi:hypothetical protein
MHRRNRAVRVSGAAAAIPHRASARGGTVDMRDTQIAGIVVVAVSL